ncbi:MAG: polysaccharide biosynthesis C-terminal domain-containing protein [Ignavibacteriaceae bacterium]
MTKPISRIIGITFVIQLIVFLLGITNNIILSRWLGPELLGLLATAVVMVEIVYKVVNPGLDTSAIYFISNNRFPVKKFVGSYFFNSIIVFLAGAALLFILVRNNAIEPLISGINSDLLSSGLWALIVYYFAFLTYEFGIKICLGLQEFKKFNQYQVVKPIILFIVLLVFSNLVEAQLYLVLFIIGLSWLVPAFIIWSGKIPFTLKFNKEITVSSLSYGLKVMLGNLLQFLVYRADILLIGFFISQTAVGWYYISVIIAEKLLYLTQATGTIFLPAASRSDEQYKKTPVFSRVNLFVVIFASIIIAVLSPWLIPLLFSQEYVNSVLPLIFLLPGIASLSVSKILSADFGARGKPQYSMYISIINFCLNIILNIILIPKIGIQGAAVSSSISYTVAAGVQCYIYKKITGTPISKLIFINSDDFKSVLKM